MGETWETYLLIHLFIIARIYILDSRGLDCFVAQAKLVRLAMTIGGDSAWIASANLRFAFAMTKFQINRKFLCYNCHFFTKF